MNASLAVSPEILLAALDNVTDGVAIFDGEWNILYMNTAGAALLCSTTDGVTGRNFFDVFPDAAGTAWHTFLLRARASDGPTSYRGYFERIDRFYTATIRPLRNELIHLSFRQDPPRATGVNDNAGRRRPDEVGDRARLRYLADVSETLSKTLNTGEAAERVAELVVPLLADWAIVAVLDEQGGTAEQVWKHNDRSAQADLDLYMQSRWAGTSGGRLLGQALRTGQPIHIPDLSAIDNPQLMPSDEVRAVAARLDPHSITLVPLQTRGHTFGVLALMITGGRPPHTELEIAQATEVARRASMPIDNARLHAQQANLVETLQRSLLADPPPLNGVDIAVRYRPASSFQRVCGDWYDAISHVDGASTLVIGDVVGHNVEAAASMSQIRSVVRTVACDESISPAASLTRVDQVLTRLHDTTMATVLLARLETPATIQAAGTRGGSRTLHWSSAGHLPPALVRPDGCVQFLDGASDLLLGTGLFDDEAVDARRTHAVDLGPGDTVLFFTDGLIEIDRADIDTGLGRLADALGPLASLGPDDLCQELLDRIAPGPTDDDIALLAVQIRDLEPAVGLAVPGRETSQSPSSEQVALHAQE